MMAWKKRTRRWRGASPLSTVSMSCGLVFILANLYILHTTFSQAYHDMANIDEPYRVDLGEEIQHGDPTTEDLRLLQGLPLALLEALGYRHIDALPSIGLQDTANIAALHDSVFGEARLRKLMGNRRESGIVTKHEFPLHELPVQIHEVPEQVPVQIPVQLPIYVNANTGRKQRTSVDRHTTVRPLYIPNPARYYGQFNTEHVSKNNNDNVLYFERKHVLHNVQSDTTSSVRFTADRRLADVSGGELRRLLLAGSRCEYVRSVSGREYVGSGWTKAVYRGHDPARDRPVAVKTLSVAGHDMATCRAGPEVCYTRASHKLLKEILLLHALDNRHIIKMLGYCVPQQAYNGDADSMVAMVTELGETIDIIRLLQMSWEDRLRVSHGVTSLLRYLADSPFGSVSLNDFRRQQFVLVSGDVTLTDLDDVSFGEPRCDVSEDCVHHFSSANFTLRTPCTNGRCAGFNERKNIFNAARHLTTFLLPHGAPPALRPAIDAIISSYSNATLRASQLLTLLENVVQRYRTGDYIQRAPADRANRYTVLQDADMPALFDYRCRFSIASGCSLSVLDQREAEQLCDLDPECRAFVISDELTWSGRMVVHLKNNVTTPTTRRGMSLCVKPSL